MIKLVGCILTLMITSNAAIAYSQATEKVRGLYTAQFLDVKTAGAGIPSTVTLRITAHMQSPRAEVRIITSSDMSIASGNTNSVMSLHAGETREVHISLIPRAKGLHYVQADIADETVLDDDILSSTSAYLHLAIGTQAGFASTSIDDRFEPAAVRDLRRQLANTSPLPDIVSGTHYGKTPPRSQADRKVSAELMRLRNLGTDALFEDTTSQIARMRGMVALDKKLQVGSQSEESIQKSVHANEISNSSACPVEPGAIYWARTGRLNFYSNNRLPTPGMMGLGNARVEAWDRSDRSGHYVVFLTNPDGSFPANVCFPVDANGWTHVFLEQRNAYVQIYREGDPDRRFFPSGWNQTWDLTVSSDLNLIADHPPTAYLLHTINRGASYAAAQFGYGRGITQILFYGKSGDNRYCKMYTVFGCHNFAGEAIYLYAAQPLPNGTIYPSVYTARGQRSALHEYGHAFLHGALDNQGWNTCNFQSHYVDAPSGLDCAFDEGFASFYSFFALQPERHGHEYNFEINNYGGGSRAPEIEGAVTSYLYDLVDSPSYPSTRPNNPDDDPISISPNHLATIIKNAAVADAGSAVRKVRSVIDFIAALDNLSPPPYKPEFGAYIQPNVVVSPAPPSGWSYDLHSHLWRWDIFRTVPPSGLGFTVVVPTIADFTVEISAPEAVSAKATYTLAGSSSHPAAGWTWQQSTDEGGFFYSWSTAQNSSFVAYAGNYTLDWRLDAVRASDGVNAYSMARTHVCVQSTECSVPPPVERPIAFGATGAVKEEMGFKSSPRTIQSAGVHYGAGVTLSSTSDSDVSVAQTYALAGAHDRATLSGSNILSGSSVVIQTRPGSLPATISVIPEESTEFLQTFRIKIQAASRNVRYSAALALDPDLGVRAGDDSLGFDIDGMVWVADPDSLVIAYVIQGIESNSVPVVRQYSTTRNDWYPDPSSSSAINKELSESSARRISMRTDVRFLLNLGSFAGAKPTEFTLHVVRGKSIQDVRAQAANLKRGIQPVVAESASLTKFRIVQAPPSALSASRVPTRISAAVIPALSGDGKLGDVEIEAAVRKSGINAMAFSVPEGPIVDVRITIVSPKGVVIKHLVNDKFLPGIYKVDWDFTNESGVRMGPGVYIAVMQAGKYKGTTKLVIVK